MTDTKKLPLMPKATAVWLIDNSTLSFQQIANFCGMHTLEVKGIADGVVAKGVLGIDPIINGQLSKEEIQRCSANEKAQLQLSIHSTYEALQNRQKKRAKYTPIARRQDKPDAICWFIKNFPDTSDAIITKLVGTTKATVLAIRDRTHWNIKNIKPRDPVLLGICSQIDLDRAIENYDISSKEKLDNLDKDADIS